MKVALFLLLAVSGSFASIDTFAEDKKSELPACDKVLASVDAPAKDMIVSFSPDGFIVTVKTPENEQGYTECLNENISSGQYWSNPVPVLYRPDNLCEMYSCQ
ncbi:hypothetical protein K2X30_08360 [bacterium]|jgi:hypothetical protein|nr:hypothetical protein [bacterium]